MCTVLRGFSDQGHRRTRINEYSLENRINWGVLRAVLGYLADGNG